MPKRQGFIISGIAVATLAACQREKETYYVTSTDGTFEGPVCYPDLRRLLRIHVGGPPTADSNTPLFDGNGKHTEDVEHAKS